jgi:adenylate cyclase
MRLARGSAVRPRLPWRHAAIAVALSVAVAAGYFLRLHDAAPFSTIEAQTLSWRFQMRGPVAPPPTVAILAIDDRTISSTNAWPLPRRLLADAVIRVHRAGAAVIGLDLLFLELEPPSDGNIAGPGDLALRAALKEAGAPVLGAALTFGPAGALPPDITAAIGDSAISVVRQDPGTSNAEVLRATGVLVPAAPLRQEATLGHVNVPVDEGGTLMRLALAIGIGGDYVPGFPLALASRFLGLPPEALVLRVGQGLHLGPRFEPTDPALRMVLNYYGPTGTIPTYPLVDLLEGRLPAGALDRRAVLIGATAIGVGDTFATPLSGDFPGVEALATATANLIAGDAIRRTTRTAAIDVAAILLLGLVTFLLAQLPSPAAAVAAGLGILLAWCAIAQVGFATHNLWLNITFPALAVLLNAGWVAIGRLVFERRLRGVAERQRENLSRFHSPLIADYLAQGEAATLDGREQPAAILFLDIAGFTGRSARIGPAETAKFLRQFHGRVEEAVLRHGGVLEQFTGDGAMVIFGVPRPGPQDAAAALACGRDLVTAIHRWSAELVRAGQAAVDIGVGIHYGPVVIARLGGDAQAQLTAAGDTVNLASRLEALTRIHHAAIVVSESLAAAVRGLGHADLLAGFEEVAPQAIRGRDQPVAVWILRQAPR